MVMEELKSTDKRLAEFNETYKTTSAAKAKYYNMKTEWLAQQMSAFQAQQAQAQRYQPYYPQGNFPPFPSTPDRS